MKKIEVDAEVFTFLQEMAEPFVDTPNTVLRRLLLESQGDSEDNKPAKPRVIKSRRTRWAKNPGDRDHLVERIKQERFGGGFSKVGRYRFMFESPKHLIYFQNFEKVDTPSLWYRVDQKVIDQLTEFGDGAFLVFTNPAESYAYILPVNDVVEHMKSVGWVRKALEVNIDHENGIWRELNWKIESYYQEFTEEE